MSRVYHTFLRIHNIILHKVRMTEFTQQPWERIRSSTSSLLMAFSHVILTNSLHNQISTYSNMTEMKRCLREECKLCFVTKSRKLCAFTSSLVHNCCIFVMKSSDGTFFDRSISLTIARDPFWNIIIHIVSLSFFFLFIWYRSLSDNFYKISTHILTMSVCGITVLSSLKISPTPLTSNFCAAFLWNSFSTFARPIDTYFGSATWGFYKQKYVQFIS